MVEFALVAPLFFLVFFGFVEYALITASISGYNFAAKDGARIGSLLGRTDPTVDQQICAAIRTFVNGIVMARPVKIEVYKSDAAGDMLTGSSGVIENVYDINGNVAGVQNWPVSTRNDTLLDADYLGVKITFTYTYLTAFVSGGTSSLTLVANSVQRLEPQDYQGHLAPPAWQIARAGGTVPGGTWPVGSAPLPAAFLGLALPPARPREPDEEGEIQ
jgi:Flp pilus assembly protein TadG